MLRGRLSPTPCRSRCHATGGIISYKNGKPRLFANALIQFMKQRAARGKHDRSLVSPGEFRRDALRSESLFRSYEPFR